MVFSSLEFIFRFLPAFLILYYIVPTRFRNIVLLLGSLCFYAWGDFKYLGLILVSILLNHIFVTNIKRCEGRISPALTDYEKEKIQTKQEKIKKRWLVLSYIFNLGMLFFFKYINLIIEAFYQFQPNDGQMIYHFGLPIGISFYTFQAISYVVDVYRGNIKSTPTLFRFATYLVMFPKLVSGPITSYGYMEEQLISRRYSLVRFENGLKVFVIGLGMKVIIANRIGMLWNDIRTIGFESMSTPLAWLGAIGYSLQLYLDFQGYSLMAIGIGEMLGFHLPENFKNPYMAKSVTEFWRRWHITLGTWFKDYVYIPLGGNRCNKLRWACNLFVVWIFTGLWHGASLNFILWGLILFVIILLEKLYLKPFLDKSNVFSRMYIVLFILLSWTLFAVNGLGEAKIYFGRMFGIIAGININAYDAVKHLQQYKWLLLIGIFLCFPYGKRIFEKYKNNIITNIVLFVLFWYSVYLLVNGTNNPFMYFQF